MLYNQLHPALLLLISAGACLLGYGTVWLLIIGVELRNDEPLFVQAAR